MKLDDIVAVIGLKNRVTELAEAMCQSLGITVFYAMKKTEPSQRIESVDEEAVVTSPFEQLPDNVFCLGLMAADSLHTADVLDCNFTSERELFGHLLGWFVHRIPSEAELPEGWRLLETSSSRLQQDFDPLLEDYPKGKILCDGRVVVNFGNGNRLLKIPESFVGIFSIMEGFCI